MSSDDMKKGRSLDERKKLLYVYSCRLQLYVAIFLPELNSVFCVVFVATTMKQGSKTNNISY